MPKPDKMCSSIVTIGLADKERRLSLMYKNVLKNIVMLATLCLLAAGCWSAGSRGQMPVEDCKKDSIRIAALSIVPEKWDKDANTEKITKMVRQAVKQGAELVITPEGVLEGYVVNEVIKEKDPNRKSELTQRFHELAEPIDGPYIEHFRNLADELDIYLVLGFLEADGRKFYNTAALFGPDGTIIGKYHKTHLWQGYDVNPPGYTAGNTYPVFDLGCMKVGMMICFDRQPPEPARLLALGGADLILCPSFGG